MSWRLRGERALNAIKTTGWLVPPLAALGAIGLTTCVYAQEYSPNRLDQLIKGLCLSLGIFSVPLGISIGVGLYKLEEGIDRDRYLSEAIREWKREIKEIKSNPDYK